MSKKRTILIYGPSGVGKSSQITELAEHVMATLGKKTLVYTIDKGGIGPYIPYIDLGIIDLIQYDGDPFFFMSKVSRGQIRGADGKWKQSDLSQYGAVAGESLTGFAEGMMNSLAEKSAQGVNIGGNANVGFTIQEDGETFKVGGNNVSHYNIVQTRILDEFWRSQKLPVQYVVWTASASKDEDGMSSGKVIGPEIVGKKLTSELPRHCDLTFRMSMVPAQQGKPKRHILHLGPSIDINSGNAMAVGNIRTPLGAEELPATIEPASIKKALELIEQAEIKAKEAINKRLGKK